MTVMALVDFVQVRVEAHSIHEEAQKWLDDQKAKDVNVNPSSFTDSHPSRRSY